MNSGKGIEMISVGPRHIPLLKRVFCLVLHCAGHISCIVPSSLSISLNLACVHALYNDVQCTYNICIMKTFFLFIFILFEFLFDTVDCTECVYGNQVLYIARALIYSINVLINI